MYTSLDTLVENCPSTDIGSSICLCHKVDYNTSCQCSRRKQQDGTSVSCSSTPRSSLSGPERKEGSVQSPSVGEALDTLFKSDEEQPMLFPASFYRTPSRSRTRPYGSAWRGSESPTLMARPMTKSPTPDRDRLTPDQALSRDRSYSPMAAGFARLNQKNRFADGSLEPALRGRAGVAKSSVELEARLFAGPA